MNFESKQNIIRICFVVVVGLLFALMIWPFFTPLLVAGLFALALENIITRLTLRFKNRHRVVLGVLSVFFMFFTIPTLLIIIKAISTVKNYTSEGGLQTTPLYQQTESILTALSEKIKIFAENFGFQLDHMPSVTDLLPQLATWLGSQVTNAVSQIPEQTLSFLVFVVALYFFLTESRKVKRIIQNLNVLQKNELNQIIEIIQNSSYLTLFSSLVVGCLQALVVSIFALFCGFNEFLVIFVVTFFFSLVPIIGAGPVAFFLAVLAFFQGHVGAGIAMLVGTVVSGTVDNIVKPMMLNSQSEDIHPALALLALIGAILIYGPLGILLGPILTSLVFKIGSILFPNVETDEA